MAKKKNKDALAVVNKDCKVYYNGYLLAFKEGDEIEDAALAQFLYDTNAPVEKGE